jgi:hypothetical protein
MRINGTGSPEAGTIKTQLDSALTNSNIFSLFGHIKLFHVRPRSASSNVNIMQ